uniref:Uncharacterized protein n=1 Tax=Schistosoma haematobium TaxID=6185 RepID=A0A094ZPS8_SCHHA
MRTDHSMGSGSNSKSSKKSTALLVPVSCGHVVVASSVVVAVVAYDESNFEMPMNNDSNIAETLVTKQPDPAPAVNLYTVPPTTSSSS